MTAADDCPGLSTPVSHAPLSEVAVWLRLEELLQLTLVPAGMVSGFGLKHPGCPLQSTIIAWLAALERSGDPTPRKAAAAKTTIRRRIRVLALETIDTRAGYRSMGIWIRTTPLTPASARP